MLSRLFLLVLPHSILAMSPWPQTHHDGQNSNRADTTSLPKGTNLCPNFYSSGSLNSVISALLSTDNLFVVTESTQSPSIFYNADSLTEISLTGLPPWFDYPLIFATNPEGTIVFVYTVPYSGYYAFGAYSLLNSTMLWMIGNFRGNARTYAYNNIANTIEYIYYDNGYILAHVDASTGAFIWKISLTSKFQWSAIELFDPATGNIIITYTYSSTNWMVCFNSQSGATVWTSETYNNNPIVLTDNGLIVVVGSALGASPRSLIGHSAKTGAIMWQVESPFQINGFALLRGTPTHVSPVVCYAFVDAKANPASMPIFVLDSATGVTLLTSPPSWNSTVVTSVITAGNTLILAGWTGERLDNAVGRIYTIDLSSFTWLANETIETLISTAICSALMIRSDGALFAFCQHAPYADLSGSNNAILTTTCPKAPGPSSSDSSLSIAAIVGIVIGSVAGAIFLVCCVGVIWVRLTTTPYNPPARPRAPEQIPLLRTCPECDGHRYVTVSTALITRQQTCSRCNGSGTVRS